MGLVLIDIVVGHGGIADLLGYFILSVALIGVLAAMWLTVGCAWMIRAGWRLAAAHFANPS